MVDYVPKMALVWLLWVWVCVCIHVYVCADTVHTGACVWQAEEDLKCNLREPLTLFLLRQGLSHQVSQAGWPLIPRSSSSTFTELELQGCTTGPLFFMQSLNSGPHVYIAST